MSHISEDLFHFQASLEQAGSSLEDFVRDNYVSKWMSDELYAAMAIRTTFVSAVHNFLVGEGLLNLERIQISPITDPLAHDVEHVPTVHYKGMPYVTTHSMIYHKFMSCFNPRFKGVFVDSPNIRLEIESPQRKQRGKYLIDFSQIDIELRRNRGISLEDYKNDVPKVKQLLKEDFERAIDFFERMIIAAVSAIVRNNEPELEALGVSLEVPTQPFPRLKHTDMLKKHGKADLDAKAGAEVDTQFFWVVGLMRENYDLIYPYLCPDGSKIPLAEFDSDMIFNYDICAKARNRETGEFTPALEVLSGAIREWLYEPIVERLLDNKILRERPVFEGGNLTNIGELDGYGPFLSTVAMKDGNGQSLFPDTMGGGIGVERFLYSILRGAKIEKIDDITCFGKNPDSFPIFLF
ncbi:amino acid--tRNA ligase-related protein [Holophaga foetida]|uniref:amino acid--tRNA ligase-related protein n=1 Tax=Holophaga foetida TaxID=35839 RepID=UPI0002471792|nr:amino acid--tRNA ligase-related protein [Holophaga foetida]